MNPNYSALTKQIRERINPENLSIPTVLFEELSTISYSDTLTFIRNAMRGVNAEYTAQSKSAGNNVITHLSREIQDISFKFQGSVMTNTHIKAYSDIDLLTISEKFYRYDSVTINHILQNSELINHYGATNLAKLQNEKNVSPYLGSSNGDLMNLRLDCENVLKNKYKIYDLSKPKSIKIKNQDLNREVDVVIANWYDDIKSIINNKGNFRGVQIFNKDNGVAGNKDYPFLRIQKINDKSSLTSGRLKKMIRFIKNIKALSDFEIKLSSFDINAICFEIDTSIYDTLKFYELVPVIYNQINSLCKNRTHSDRLMSVDEREFIFKNDEEKLNQLRILRNEIQNIYMDLLKQNILK